MVVVVLEEGCKIKRLFGLGMIIAAIPAGIGADILILMGLYGIVSDVIVYLAGWVIGAIVAAVLMTFGFDFFEPLGL